jgi:addiction module RelB/DinJ family antitoxin
MGQSILSVRMDENLKKQFDVLCKHFGLSTSAAVTVFAKKVVGERKIPFEIGDPENQADSPAKDTRMKVWSPRSGYHYVDEPENIEKTLATLQKINADLDKLNKTNPLPPEFDKILSHRFNISRKLDL